jgi:hypothetical protein
LAKSASESGGKKEKVSNILECGWEERERRRPVSNVSSLYLFFERETFFSLLEALKLTSVVVDRGERAQKASKKRSSWKDKMRRRKITRESIITNYTRIQLLENDN